VRRWISTFLTVLMLTNVALGPTAAVAEVLEHDQEAIHLDDKGAPAESEGTHCKHGCAGHYGHHFQLQASSLSYQTAPAVSAAAIAIAVVLPPKFIPTLPFRPPLPA
jgi:hypothetical protein